MRKNIFEILSENLDVNKEIKTIWHLLKSTTVFIQAGLYEPDERISLLEFVNIYSFNDWKARNRCISTVDMMERLGISEKKINVMSEFTNDTIILLEFIMNMIILYDRKITSYVYKVTSDYFLLNENISILLEHFGYRAHYFEDEEQLVIIEKDPAAISVAEISESDIAKRIIQYNHYALKGNIEIKKEIIIALEKVLEPQRNELKNICPILEADLYCLLNNMNIRHNNIEPSDKNYRSIVANMEPAELEKWYDDIYQMILLSKLLLDNKNRQLKIKELKNIF